MSPFIEEPVGLDVEELISQLTIDEKVSLLAGKDFWHTFPVPRLGIPSIRLSDGPNGVRGTRFFDSVPSSCLPCGTAIGATFNTELATRIGNMLAGEGKAKGAHVILGPTINIQRGPLGGRGFESFSEDPLLSGTIAGSYCQGIQEKGIAATLKHFVCNDMEDERMAVNVLVTERALREIYLAPFQTAIRMAQPRAIMTSYSQVNGTHAAENFHLLQEVLRDEWKWDGLVMSDWFGTYSTTEAVQAGLDLEMPGPSRWRGPALTHAVAANKVKDSDLDARVRNVLNLVDFCRHSGVPENAPEREMNTPENRSLLLEAATQSIVLLKNEIILPLKKTKVAVIGPNSKIATYCGGGSASLNPYYTMTPYEGMAKMAEVSFSQGALGHQILPELGPSLRTAGGQKGFEWKVYNEPPGAAVRRLLERRVLTDANIFFLDYDHPELAPIWFSDAEGILVVEEDGLYDFGLSVHGTARLYVDGKLLISNVENQKAGSSFLGSGTVEELGEMELVAGKQYRILVQWGCAKTSKLKRPGVVDFGHGGFRFSACKRMMGIQDEAVRLAASSEQVVLFAGLSGEWESEGEDRKTMDLPPHTDELISKVLDANPNTVVVVQAGTPVAMPWINKAKAVVYAWYGGNETGNAIADVLFGDANPSGKLPLTLPQRLKDNPTYLNYSSEAGRCLYGEDVYVGYRYYDMMDIAPLFPFGHGLSYTTFEIADVELGETLQVKVKNTGSRAGAEVVQVYVAPVSPVIQRPLKELKAFQRVSLEAGAESVVDVDCDTMRWTSFWDEKKGRWCSHAGLYRILVGTSSSEDFLEASLEVPKTTYWLGL